jgi:hydroxyethylthiazole kinase-like uncharacterized protein yjeF
MSTSSEWVLGPHGLMHPRAYPLLCTAALRTAEVQSASALPAHTLMRRAGLALSQLTLAYAPHAQTVWVACGRGNNGGDGFEAAMHLQQLGKKVWLSLPESRQPLPTDAVASLQRAQAAGVIIQNGAPLHWDVCIDALLGVGLREAPTGAPLAAMQAMLTGNGDIIAADVPSGLNADTGHTPGACVKARATLSFLALKPGLFTAQGRDFCGDLWLNKLETTLLAPPDAWLNTGQREPPRPHASHKGSFGDVVVVGGASGMVGAAVLAGATALNSGAGRVYLSLLAPGDYNSVFATHPGLMQCSVENLAITQMTVVAGCGGGSVVGDSMPRLLAEARQLVLDADALNALAHTPDWRPALAARPIGTTAITPHPLEAARLLGCSTADVQKNRLASAQELAHTYQCTVVLKGSGTIIANPKEVPHINPTGNSKLATAGTGDVLAGLLGSLMAQGQNSFDAARNACYRHGQVADQWTTGTALTALRMVEKI